MGWKNDPEMSGGDPVDSRSKTNGTVEDIVIEQSCELSSFPICPDLEVPQRHLPKRHPLNLLEFCWNVLEIPGLQENLPEFP